MAKHVLEILDGDRAGDIVSVPDRPLRIGRKSANDLVLADEKTSGVHAEIVLEGDRHVLRDLGSTNGTFLDGRRVTEVVLTAGDVITIGRLRVKFRDEGGPSGAAPADFAMHRLDATRVPKRRGSLLLLVLLVIALAGGGGFWWWQGQQQERGGEGAVQKSRPALVVAGNKLPSAVASCDDAEGWTLAARGAGFAPTTRRNSGEGAFEATRPEGEGAADYAIAMLGAPLTVLSGRTLTLEAWVQSAGAARVGVRGVCWSSSDAGGLRFRVGTPLQPAEGWTRVAAQFAVPPGCDRLDVELVALLPDQDAAAYVDDVAVSEGGDARAIDLRIAEGGQSLVGTGAALAVRSTELTLLGLLPGEVEAPFRSLHAAGLCALSDLGRELTVTAQERGVTLATTGSGGLEFVFPAESAGQVLARAAADGLFDGVAAESAFEAADVLLGNQLTRAMVHLPEPAACSGRFGEGVYRLRVAAASVELVLGFRAEKQQALDLLRDARDREAEGAPGRALELLRELRQTVPQDSDVLGQAMALRGEILGRLDEAVTRLQKELEEAQFFDTRGGFERVQQGVDQLVERYAGYAELDLENREPIVKLREGARTRLEELDLERLGAERQRLDDLAQAFAAAGQTGLAKLVADYKQQHLGK